MYLHGISFAINSPDDPYLETRETFAKQNLAEEIAGEARFRKLQLATSIGLNFPNYDACKWKSEH